MLYRSPHHVEGYVKVVKGISKLSTPTQEEALIYQLSVALEKMP